MALVLSLALVALGAVLLLGLDRSLNGVELNTIGVILIVLGALGALVSLASRERPAARHGAGDPSRPDPGIDAPTETSTDQTWPRPRAPR